MPMGHPYSIAVFGTGNAMWPSPRAFELYSAGAVQPMPCPIFNDIKLDTNTDWALTRTHGASNGQYPEIWFFWPSASSTSGECDRYVIYNYLENWWGWGYLGAQRHDHGAVRSGGLWPARPTARSTSMRTAGPMPACRSWRTAGSRPARSASGAAMP